MKRIVVLIATALTAAGCASTLQPSAQFSAAESAVIAARADAEVATRSRLELDRAEQLLAAARGAEDERQMDHLAYLAERQAALARENARVRSSEEAVRNASAEREKIIADIRERQATAAQARASAAQNAAQDAERRAQTARNQAAEQTAQAKSAEERAAAQAREAESARARAAELESKLAALSARQTPRGYVVTLGDVLFDVGRSDLRQVATRDLDRLAQFLRDYPDRRVAIEGHTDNTGSHTLNQTLSEQRAAAVRSALVVRGVGPDRITTQGFAESNPVADNATATGRALNRRVEVVIGGGGDDGRVSQRR